MKLKRQPQPTEGVLKSPAVGLSENTEKKVPGTLKDNPEALTEESKIGVLSGNVKISIYPEPSGIASFHIKASDWEIVVGIKDFSVLEVIYGRSPFKKKDKISGKLKKRLVEFFNSPLAKGITYWEYLILAWCLNNDKYEIDHNTKIPE